MRPAFPIVRALSSRRTLAQPAATSPGGANRWYTISPMEILRFSPSVAERIGWRPYDVQLASSIELVEGEGEAHVYVIYLEPGGVIGPHEAGFGQIFLSLAGSGWIAGGDGRRVTLSEGEAAFISRGEVHSKGSEGGMTAFMAHARFAAPPQSGAVRFVREDCVRDGREGDVPGRARHRSRAKTEQRVRSRRERARALTRCLLPRCSS